VCFLALLQSIRISHLAAEVAVTEAAAAWVAVVLAEAF
jgi:hypothetical protein